MDKSSINPLRAWGAAACRSLLSLGLLSSAGCASLPEPAPKPVTRAFALQPNTTFWGGRVAAHTPDAERSGLRLLLAGQDALAALNALIERSQRSLDLQYYLIRDEASTRRLLRGVAAAAQRGVRVRLLLDDLNTAGQEDLLLCLARQPNVDVRLYNPFPAGRFSTLTRLLASATDAARISARMHSKMLVADNAIAVAGGRNLGDAYFVRSESSNFVDLDMLVAGPLVRRLSSAFDRFWNDDLAYPLQRIVTREGDCAGAAQRVAPADGAEPAAVPLARELAHGVLDLRWVPATLLADKPSKITSEGEPRRDETIADDIDALIAAARHEVVMISPYHVPGPNGLRIARDLEARGVQLRVLTNSLAATDAPAVHIGYAKYREPLLRLGVELHELRPRLGTPDRRLGSFGSSQSSLHAKALVIDRSVVIIGSMNMDPRSANLNSEIGMVLRSPDLAAQLVKLYEDVSRDNSWRVQLDARARLRWTGRDADGAARVFDSEPEASAWLRMLLLVLSPFAPEELL